MNTAMRSSLPPKTVAWLGYGGLLPFVIPTLTALIDRVHAPVYAWLVGGYGAVILTFVGALHWGFAMLLEPLSPNQRTALYVWSVVPALMAWPALLWLQVAPGRAIGILIAGFLLHLLQDFRLARTGTLPAWYLPLRVALSAIAVLCLAVAALVQRFAFWHG